MAQFSNFDSNRPQRLAIEWQEIHERDDDAGKPDANDDGFWPSRDPDAAGYVAPERFSEAHAGALARMAAWESGEWYYIGIRARASLSIPIGGNSFRRLVIESAGLWGVESDSGAAYLRECYAEEKSELKRQLEIMGAALATGEAIETESGVLAHD